MKFCFFNHAQKNEGNTQILKYSDKIYLMMKCRCATVKNGFMCTTGYCDCAKNGVVCGHECHCKCCGNNGSYNAALEKYKSKKRKDSQSTKQYNLQQSTPEYNLQEQSLDAVQQQLTVYQTQITSLHARVHSLEETVRQLQRVRGSSFELTFSEDPPNDQLHEIAREAILR
jgi:hypothetical protein